MMYVMCPGANPSFTSVAILETASTIEGRLDGSHDDVSDVN